MFHREIIIEQHKNAFYHVPSIVTAPDGSILAFCEQRWQSPCDDVGECHIVMKKSHDHGLSWGELRVLRRQEGAKWHMGSAVTDHITGRVLLMCGGGWLQSRDNGESWTDWKPALHAGTEVMVNAFGSTHGSSPGIQLRYGKKKNRLVWPARAVISDSGYDDRSVSDRQNKCYSIALYSDDHGRSIRQSNIFHRGTGEGSLVELGNGDIYFNARAYFNDGKRRGAVSRDWGVTFTEVPENQPIQEVPQGCNACMIGYPPHLINSTSMAGYPAHLIRSASMAGYPEHLVNNKPMAEYPGHFINNENIVLFANPDTKGPHREHGVVRMSLDGGKTWPFSREISARGEWFDYSSMTVAADGTILVMYKTTPSLTGLPTSPDGCCSMAVARFDLDWLIPTDCKVSQP
ncbi:MAG: exo-alpha-sialidase [Desulfamplus sp.]|nr:exo-alpha-sialidase [Desulfamplus sp.]